MVDQLKVEVRDQLGTGHSRRLRRSGKVPAVLYGHGEQTVHLAVCNEELAALIRHGSKLVDLQGAVNENALLREVQWDTFGHEILHLDLTRVRAGESVQVTVTVELRGDAPGARLGGIVEHVTHEIELECPADSIPDKIEVNINELELDDAVLASDLEIPSRAKLLADPGTLIVHCVPAAAEAEEEEGAEAAETAEPEIIGRKAEEEESAGD